MNTMTRLGLSLGLAAAGLFLATLGACSASSGGGGGGTDAGYGTGAVGNTGGMSPGGGGMNPGGGGMGNTGGMNPGGGGMTSGGGGMTSGGGGSGGGSATLPAGCWSGAAPACNPVNNAGCTGAGEACDLGDDGSGGAVLQCFPPPNDVPTGGTCDNSAGPFCQPTNTCAQGKCAKYCCSSSDCAGKTCQALDATLGTLGVCM